MRAVPAPLLVIGAMVSVQLGSAVAATMFDDVTPLGVAFLRQAIAAIILLAATRPRLRRWSREKWIVTVAYGIALAGMNIAFYSAIGLIPLGLAVTLEFLGPLTMALVLSRRWRDAAWALMAGAGVVLLGWTPYASGNGAGYVLALVAAVFWVAYIVITRRVGQSFKGLDGLAVALAIAAVITVPVGARSASTVLGEPSLIVRAFMVAVLSSIVVYVLEMAALRRMQPRVFGIVLSLEPAIAAVAGLIVLGQVLTITESAGLVLVSIASAAVAWDTRSTDAAAPP